MRESAAWANVLSQVIDDVICAVDNGDPHSVDAWIGLEELLGAEQTKEMWADTRYRPVVVLLDEYCHAAQHDRGILFGKIPAQEAKSRLVRCRELLAQGSPDFLDSIEGLA